MSVLLAAPPDILRWSPRSRGHGDCAVSALELACGVSYETALAAAVTVNLTVLGTGLTLPAMRQAAKLLGFKVRFHRAFDIDEDTGILWLVQAVSENGDHAAYLWEGRVVEPMQGREQLWLSARAYLAHYKYTVQGLLAVEEHAT